MGMYTEFYFRGEVRDGPCADWLNAQINGVGQPNGEPGWFYGPQDLPRHNDLVHEWFNDPQWYMVFVGGGAVYQQSRRPSFEREYNHGPFRLVLSSSAKKMMAEEFITWITPHLKMSTGDFLGYSLYEDTCDDARDWREHPTLYFLGREPVRA